MVVAGAARFQDGLKPGTWLKQAVSFGTVHPVPDDAQHMSPLGREVMTNVENESLTETANALSKLSTTGE